MKTLILLIFISIFTRNLLFSQTEKPLPSKTSRITDFYIQPGTFSQRLNNGTLNDFKLLAPDSKFLQTNFSDFRKSGYNDIYGNSMLSIAVGLKLGKRENNLSNSNTTLRLGINYLTGYSLTNSYYKTDRKRYDTLTSSQTNQQIFVDSVTSTSYTMDYSYNQLRLDGSLIFSTNSKARWSLYTGFGASLGVSINAKTDIYYSKNKFSETMFQNGNLIYENTRNDGDEYETETFRNKTNIGLSAYVPLGIDFRIGKKNEFWKRAHLYYELRPGLNMTTIPELRTIINPGIQYGLGFRFSIK